MSSLFSELRRRNVFRVAAAYTVTAWITIEVLATVLPIFGVPDWVLRVVVILVVAGFVPAVFFAWAFELTAEGIKRQAEVDRSESIADQTAKKLDVIVIVLLVIAIGFVTVDRLVLERDGVGVSAGDLVAMSPADTQSAAARDLSIAVLPFADMSPDKDQEYFSDGIAEELLNALSRVRDLRVAGRTSSFHFRDRNEDLRTIGETLGVAYILEGSVRKSADRVRITAQLISADDGFHLWSETYDGELKDIFDLQERIARAITTELEVVLSGKQQERIVEVATENTEAYSLFLQATAIFNRRDRDRLVHASGLLEEALRLDPDFTRARSRMAAVQLITPAYASVDQSASFVSAERQAQIAITQDDRLAEPHAVLGLLYANKRRHSDAHAEFLRALELDPADVTSNFWFGIHLWMSGYRNQAVRYLDEVVKIDPMLPIGLNWRALAYLDQGDLPNARRLYQRAYDLGLVSAGAQGQGAIAELEGDRDLAARLFAQGMGRAFALPGGPDAAETFSAGLYGGPADRQKALDLIEEYLASDPEGIHGLVPNVLMRIGQAEQALELAASAPLINESLFFAPLWVRPFGDAARQSPFFPEFARRTGLAEYWDQYGPPDGCRRQADDHYVCK